MPPLKVGDFWAWSPYAFLHRDQFTWFPTPEQQSDARAKLPYNARTRFIHQRMDSRFPAVYTYVRRPLYYAAFNSGKHLTDQQRLGLGLLWSPTAGALLQSQTDSKLEPPGDLNVTFAVSEETSIPSPGFRDLPDGILTIRTPEKTMRFLEDSIEVNARHSGPVSEIIPLLAADRSDIQVTPNGTRQQGLAVIYSPQVTASLEQTSMRVGKKRVIILRLEAPNELHYSLSFKQ